MCAVCWESGSMVEEERLVLRVLAGPNAGSEATLGSRMVVGSGEIADIVIGDPAVHPEHFSIELSDGIATLAVGADPIFIKGKRVADERLTLAPFDLIQAGSTLLAIGPRHGQWPSPTVNDFTVAGADLDPVEQPPSTAVPSDSVAAEQPGVPEFGSRRSERPFFAIAVCTVLALVAIGIGITLYIRQPEVLAEPNARRQLEEIVASIDIPTISIVNEDGGGFAVVGSVSTNQQLARLNQALAQLAFTTKVQVVSLEQQVTAMRTIVSHAGAKLTIEPSPQSGVITVTGVLLSSSTFAGLRALFERDIANLRPIEDHIVYVEAAASEARARLAGSGLANSTKVEAAGEEIRVSGGVTEAEKESVRQIVGQLGRNWEPALKFVDVTAVVAAAAKPALEAVPLPQENVAIVVVGPTSFFYDGKGQRYAVGDKLPNGDVIEAIKSDEVVIRRGDSTLRYPVMRRF
jgi:type III secretion system YscD/HrpQ family protein